MKRGALIWILLMLVPVGARAIDTFLGGGLLGCRELVEGKTRRNKNKGN